MLCLHTEGRKTEQKRYKILHLPISTPFWLFFVSGRLEQDSKEASQVSSSLPRPALLRGRSRLWECGPVGLWS